MAYNPNFSLYQNPYTPYSYPYQQQFYNPNMSMQSQQNQQNAMLAQQNMQNSQQIQNNGFIRVQSEEEARKYPVAPGGSVTFIDENAPYCYTKSVDMSQLDRPIFKKFRLVEENQNSDSLNLEAKKEDNAKVNFEQFAKTEDLEKIENDYKKLKIEIEKIKQEFECFSNQTVKNTTKTNKKKDSEENEQKSFS